MASPVTPQAGVDGTGMTAPPSSARGTNTGASTISLQRAPSLPGSKVYVRGVGPARVVRNTSEDEVQVSFDCRDNACYNPGDVVSPDGRLDFLRPAANSSSRQVSLPSAVFSLLSTMLGGGVLSLPFAFREVGLVVALISTSLSAVASGFSIDLLIAASRATGADSYESVAQRAFGRWGRPCVSALMVMLIFLTQVAYLVLVADLLVPILDFLPGALTTSTKGIRIPVVIGAVTLISPLCFQTRLHALRFMSIIAFLALSIVVTALTIRAAGAVGREHFAYIRAPSGAEVHVLVSKDSLSRVLWPVGFTETLYAFPIFGLAFLCHFNVLPMHSEFAQPTRKRTKRVVHIAMFVCNILYCIAGWCGMAYAGEWTCGNILLNFSSKDVLVNVARIALSMTLLGTFPLLILPCRANLHQLVTVCQSMLGGQAADSQAEEDAGPDADLAQNAESQNSRDVLASPEAIHVYERRGRRERAPSEMVSVGAFLATDGAGDPLPWSRLSFVSETIGLMLFSTILACVLDSVLVIFTIAGAMVSFTIAFTLPALMWIRLHSHHAKPLKIWMTRVLLAVSVFCSIGCTYAVVINLAHPACPAPPRSYFETDIPGQPHLVQSTPWGNPGHTI